MNVSVANLARRLWPYPPCRHIPPSNELLSGPHETLVFVAGRAGIWDLVSTGHCRRNESEGMAADILVGKRLFDLRHVASDAFPAWAA